MEQVLGYFFLVSGAVLSGVASVLLRETSPLIFGTGFDPQSLSIEFGLGILLYGTSFLLWVLTLSRLSLQGSYPLVIGLTYLTILAITVLYLGEPLRWQSITGAVLIFVGVFAILRG